MVKLISTSRSDSRLCKMHPMPLDSRMMQPYSAVLKVGRNRQNARLYDSDALGLQDDELCNDVGVRLYQRCQTVLMVSRNEVTCPRCMGYTAARRLQRAPRFRCAPRGDTCIALLTRPGAAFFEFSFLMVSPHSDPTKPVTQAIGLFVRG